MKRIVSSVFGVAILLGTAGCGNDTGGGAGLPADRSEITPIDLPKTDMAAGKINLNKIKSQGPTPTATPEPEKK